MRSELLNASGLVGAARLRPGVESVLLVGVLEMVSVYVLLFLGVLVVVGL